MNKAYMNQVVLLDLESRNGSLVVSYLAVQQFKGQFLTFTFECTKLLAEINTLIIACNYKCSVPECIADYMWQVQYE